LTIKRFFTNSNQTENTENFPEITRHERLNLLFPDLIDVMDIAMWELDLNYRVVASNKKAKKIYGDHVIGKFCYYAAADRDKICPRCPAKMVYNGCESGRSEHQRTDITGKKIYIDHIATPIKNKDGQLIGCLVIIIDITNRKLMEKELKRHRNALEKLISERTRALKQSEEKYRRLYNESKKAEAVYCSLLNSSADAIIIYDLEGRTQHVSSGFTRLFGWSLDELKGKRIDYVPEAELEKSITHINNAIQRGISCPGFESKRYKKDGRLVDVSISASGYTDHEGKLSGLLVILRDISEQKRLEVQLRHSQKMKAIGTLSSGIAHDFNNILSIILGNSELALYGLPKSKSLYSFLEEIRIASLRAKDVVKQLLSFSRKSEENRFPINIVPIVIESLKLLRSSVSANIEFRQNISKKFLIAPESFDLAIADMAMPKMTGDKFIRELLNIKPDLPAILCTGYSEWMDENKALEMGIKWFLIKPIDMQKMAVAVKEALNYNKCYTEFLIPL